MPTCLHKSQKSKQHPGGAPNFTQPMHYMFSCFPFLIDFDWCWMALKDAKRAYKTAAAIPSMVFKHLLNMHSCHIDLFWWFLNVWMVLNRMEWYCSVWCGVLWCGMGAATKFFDVGWRPVKASTKSQIQVKKVMDHPKKEPVWDFVEAFTGLWPMFVIL